MYNLPLLPHKRVGPFHVRHTRHTYVTGKTHGRTGNREIASEASGPHAKVKHLIINTKAPSCFRLSSYSTALDMLIALNDTPRTTCPTRSRQ